MFAIVAVLGMNTQSYALERWLRVHNDTNISLCYIYITHVDDGDWGADLLGPCIEPGGYAVVDPGWQQGYCRMDMKFVFSDDDEVVRNDYNICEGTDFTIY